MLNNKHEPPRVDTDTTQGRLALLEWRQQQVERTLANFSRAAWTVAATVVGALVVYYLTSRGAQAP